MNLPRPWLTSFLALSLLLTAAAAAAGQSLTLAFANDVRGELAPCG